MKILVIGGSGTIGKAVVNLLSQEYEVLNLGKIRGEYQVDLEDKKAIKQMFKDIPNVDGIISLPGDGKMNALGQIRDEEMQLAINSKITTNLNLIQEGIQHINKNGFIVVTSGLASIVPLQGALSMSVACAGLEAMVKATTAEDTNGIRINAVRPALVKESMELVGLKGDFGIPASETAKVFKHATEIQESGQTIDVAGFLKEQTLGAVSNKN